MCSFLARRLSARSWNSGKVDACKSGAEQKNKETKVVSYGIVSGGDA
jgi:hypothetical protein